MTISATLALRPDAERVRLRLATAFIQHRVDLWPEGELGATPERIRTNVDDILLLLEQLIGWNGHCVRRLPRRVHWVIWLLDDLDRRTTSEPVGRLADVRWQ
jgi:hypothetical protein